MNSQIQFETNGLRVLVVAINKRWDIAGIGGDALFYWPNEASRNIGDYPHSIHLKDGDWKIICTTDAMTEEQAKVLVRKAKQSMEYGFWDYYSNSPAGLTFYNNPVGSFYSLLRSNGINPNEKHVILIELK